MVENILRRANARMVDLQTIRESLDKIDFVKVDLSDGDSIIRRENDEFGINIRIESGSLDENQENQLKNLIIDSSNGYGCDAYDAFIYDDADYDILSIFIK